MCSGKYSANQISNRVSPVAGKSHKIQRIICFAYASHNFQSISFRIAYQRKLLIYEKGTLSCTIENVHKLARCEWCLCVLRRSQAKQYIMLDLIFSIHPWFVAAGWPKQNKRIHSRLLISFICMVWFMLSYWYLLIKSSKSGDISMADRKIMNLVFFFCEFMTNKRSDEKV